MAARGKALYENTTRGLGADKVVALYHRVAAGERQYQKCLPRRPFYARARRQFEQTIFPNRTVAYITSSYQFRDAAAIASVLGADVRALDDREPAVVGRADARGRGDVLVGVVLVVGRATARGSVLYDRGLRNSTWLETSGCGALVFGGGAGPADARRFADEHARDWRPVCAFVGACSVLGA